MSTSDGTEAMKSLEEWQSNLAKFCEQFSIKRFEPEDIIELLEDNEEIDWLIEQLKLDNADLDEESAREILSEIKNLVGKPEEIVSEDAEDELADDLIEEISQAAEEIDFSKLDFKELAPVLEEMTGGKPIDPRMLNQIQAMMQGEQGKLMTDFSLWCQEHGIKVEEITDPQKLEEINAQWMQTPRPAFGGKTPAEMTKSAGIPGFTKVETYHRETPKIGRNDPCPCGSGKKYKKCCGRNL